MIAFKLLRRRKDGTLGPLFINRKQRIPFNQTLPAEAHSTKGYAFRPGWHCLAEPKAPHLSEKGRVWCKVRIAKFQEFTRPECQGGKWFLAQEMTLLEVLS